MHVQLSNIVEHPDTNNLSMAYSAFVLINGTKAAVVFNDGKGNTSIIKGLDANGTALLKTAKAYFQKELDNAASMQPAPTTFTPTLQHHLDDIAMRFLINDRNTVFHKKITDASIDSIVYGLPGNKLRKYTHLIPIATKLKTDKGTASIKTILAKIKGDLKPGEVIFNSNLPPALLEGFPTAAAVRFKKDHILKAIEQAKKGNRP